MSSVNVPTALRRRLPHPVLRAQVLRGRHRHPARRRRRLRQESTLPAPQGSFYMRRSQEMEHKK